MTIEYNINTSGFPSATGLFISIRDRTSFSGNAETQSLVFKLAESTVQARLDNAPNTITGGPVLGGVTWPGVTPEYLNQRPDRAGATLGIDTGLLRDSYRLGSSNNIAFARQNNELVFGSTLVRAVGFEFGTGKAGEPSRARPLLFVSEEFSDNVANRVADFVIS